MTEYRTARPESLEQVFLCYTKDNLQDIAKKHGLKGFSKWNKKDLAKWLRDQLLDEAVMGEIVKQASADETRFFESAIQEQGILISQELVADSLLLTTYGAYDPKQELYLVPGMWRPHTKKSAHLICRQKKRTEIVWRIMQNRWYICTV